MTMPKMQLTLHPSSNYKQKPKGRCHLERMHQTVATVLKTLLLAQSPQTHCHVALLVGDALVTAMHALQSTLSTTLQAMPGGLVFS